MGENTTLLKEFSGLAEAPQRLLAQLEAMGIAHDTYAHAPIFTVEEGIALNLPGLIPGQHGKSLFLTDRVDGLWLVVACEETRVNLKGLSDRLGSKRFSFAKPETMVEVLGVTPGSATPFAVMNDTNRRVKIVLEDKFLESSHCVFHPLINSLSTRVKVEDLLRFIRHYGYEPRILPLA